MEPGSPAAKTGIKVGDVIVAFDGAPVAGASDLRNKIGLKQAGETVVLGVSREGASLTFTTALSATSAGRLSGASLDKRLAGVVFAPLSESAASGRETAGVQVVQIDRGSAAADAGFQKGDVITSVNRQPVTTLDDFARAVRSATDALVFSVVRGDVSFFLVIQ